MDRSWYNRAGVEHVMEFCTEEQYLAFLRQAPRFEQLLVEDGILLFKYWLTVDQEEQEERFAERHEDPLKGWKLSPVDLQSRNAYADYTHAREAMLQATHTEWAPWTLVDFNDQKRGRLDLDPRPPRSSAGCLATGRRAAAAEAGRQAAQGEIRRAQADTALSARRPTSPPASRLATASRWRAAASSATSAASSRAMKAGHNGSRGFDLGDVVTAIAAQVRAARQQAGFQRHPVGQVYGGGHQQPVAQQLPVVGRQYVGHVDLVEVGLRVPGQAADPPGALAQVHDAGHQRTQRARASASGPAVLRLRPGWPRPWPANSVVRAGRESRRAPAGRGRPATAVLQRAVRRYPAGRRRHCAAECRDPPSARARLRARWRCCCCARRWSAWRQASCCWRRRRCTLRRVEVAPFFLRPAFGVVRVETQRIGQALFLGRGFVERARAQRHQAHEVHARRRAEMHPRAHCARHAASEQQHREHPRHADLPRGRLAAGDPSRPGWRATTPTGSRTYAPVGLRAPACVPMSSLPFPCRVSVPVDRPRRP